MTYSPCFLIPCYNHGAAVTQVILSLKSYSLPIIMVDDGSDEATKSVLGSLAQDESVTLLTLAENQGRLASEGHGKDKRGHLSWVQ